MPRQPHPARRLATMATWPVGIVLTGYDYMWRITPLHRGETHGQDPDGHEPPALRPGVSHAEVMGADAGSGPLFHRSYRTRIRNSPLDADALFETLCTDLTRAVPLTLARFHKVKGEKHSVEVGDEYSVRMPGPWNGPVRVVDRTPRSFRLATLQGHLEAGQIEFRVLEDPEAEAGGRLIFEIESWTRSADALVNLLYTRLRIAKEVQAHMWISFLENVVKVSGGHMTHGIDVETHRVG